MTNPADTEQQQEQTDQQQDQQQDQDQANEQGGAGGDQVQDDAEEGELVVSFGEESPPPEAEEVPENAPAWVKTLRADQQELKKTIRERDRENRELKQKLEAVTAPKVVPELKKPTMESVDYDEAEYERQFDAYTRQKAEQDAKQREKDAADKAEKDAWAAKVEAYRTAKTALKVKDYDEAEAEAMALLSETQQGIIVDGAENAALLVYALGKNPEQAKQLASIKNPVKFAFAVAKLETKLKATPRKAPPAAESTVRGSGSISSTSGNSELARLEAAADKSGDRTAVIAYRRKMRQQAAK